MAEKTVQGLARVVSTSHRIGYSREVTSGFLVLALFFRNESRQSDNVCVDLLIAHRSGSCAVTRHDCGDLCELVKTMYKGLKKKK